MSERIAIMRSYIEEACEEIDSSVFSGDAFIDKEHRKKLRDFMARWEKELKGLDKL